jgi:hypothetical protein
MTDLSFRRRGVWRDVLPRADYANSGNVIELYRERFNADLFTAKSNYFTSHQTAGTPLNKVLKNGNLLLSNESSSFASQAFGTGVRPTAPFFSIMAHVDEISAFTNGLVGERGHASDISIGVIKDEENFISTGYNASNDWVEVFQKVDGKGTSYNQQASTSTNRFEFPDNRSIPTPPFDLLTIFFGDIVAVLTRKSHRGWQYHGKAPIDSAWDFYDQTEWQDWEVHFRCACAPNEYAAISDLKAFHGFNFGVRDPIPVTYKDGAPVIENNKLWMAITPGGCNHRGYQLIGRVNLDTYHVEPTAALFCEAKPNYVSNYVASHIMYDQEREEFFIFWSGFGNGPKDPSSGRGQPQKVWLSRTPQNILRGTHYLPAEKVQFPHGSSSGGGVHDAFVVYDEQAGMWRALHNYDMVDEVAISETADDNLLTGWKVLDTYRDTKHQIEGGKLSKVNGKYVVAYADYSLANGMVWAEYPTVSANRTEFDLDHPTLDEAPHPTVVPVPTARGTKYVLISMDESTMFGQGEASHGAFYFYEANQRTADYEWPIRTGL